MEKHSVNCLPSATLGKHDSVNNDSVKLVYRVSTNGALGEKSYRVLRRHSVNNYDVTVVSRQTCR